MNLIMLLYETGLTQHNILLITIVRVCLQVGYLYLQFLQ